MRPVNIPAGIMDKSVEIFIHNNELFVLYNGKQTRFDFLPEKIKDLFMQHMMANKKALTSLIQDFRLSDPAEMLSQYVKCNFGNFDNMADANEDGVIVSEVWNCGCRGKCPGEGKICSLVQGPNGNLTKRELEIFMFVVDGKIDKEIAEILEISQATLETHLARIRQALGVNNRLEIMKFAIERKILSI
jgi:DNA-binding CsgD family transcriptional regulator